MFVTPLPPHPFPQIFQNNNYIFLHIYYLEKHKYLFHGTQVLEDSPSILENGLLMMRKDLGSTTVKEMTQEELLLYERRRNDGKYWNRICCNN